MAECTAKHTRYQPTEAEWLCPKCKANNESFWTEEPDGEASDTCDKLHEKDEIYCYKCNWAGSGKTFTKKLQDAQGLVKCECCKGTGLVKIPVAP